MIPDIDGVNNLSADDEKYLKEYAMKLNRYAIMDLAARPIAVEVF
jgi:hypothetical protein